MKQAKAAIPTRRRAIEGGTGVAEGGATATT
jgi:hypothetical protein